MAIKAAAIRIRPRRLPRIVCPSGLPEAYAKKGIRLTSDTANPIIKTEKAAKNLAQTMLVVETGAEIRSVSVRCFFSSANSFMVRSGMRIIKEKTRAVK